MSKHTVNPPQQFSPSTPLEDPLHHLFSHAIDKKLHRTVNTSVKIRIRSIISLLVVAAIFLAIGYFTGLRRGQYQAALEEAKVSRAALKRDDITLEPQLREYMKGRIYYLIGTKFYDARSQFGSEWNEGTVDTNILQTPIYAKDSTFAPRTYTEAIADIPR